MAIPRLVHAKWLRNHGLTLYSRSYTGKGVRRFVPADGHLTIGEAAKVLGSYDVKLYRMIAARDLKTVRIGGVRMVPMSEARRLRSLWRRGKAAA